MLQTTGLTRARDFESLREEWSELAEQCPDATIFQSQEWLSSWWEHLGRRTIGRKLLLIIVRQDGKLVGLAPLMTSFWQGTPLRRVSFLGVGVSDYQDVLALPDQEETVCQAVYDYLGRAAYWQVADFAQMREGGVLRRNPPRNGSLDYQDSAGENCPFLELPKGEKDAGDPWEALLSRYSKKFRSNLRYYDRALDKGYSVQRGVAATEKELDEALAALFDLHQRRWNERWLPGVLGSGPVREFHRAVARKFLQRGWLRLHTLALDGEIVAALYCFAYKDRTAYYQGGFEPTLGRLSLGTTLTGHAIRLAMQEGRAQFDFLRGDEPYKERWTGGRYRVNHRRVAARRGTLFLAPAAGVAKLEQSIEARFKEWMHRHGASGQGRAGRDEKAVQEDGIRDHP